jgi:hypothetical protein
MSLTVRSMLLTGLLGLSGFSHASDFNAPEYHEGNCTRCHDSGVYTRENRRVGSYSALQTQVQRCDANLGTRLFPEDLELLVDHLNAEFYKFSE